METEKKPDPDTDRRMSAGKGESDLPSGLRVYCMGDRTSITLIPIPNGSVSGIEGAGTALLHAALYVPNRQSIPGTIDVDPVTFCWHGGSTSIMNTIANFCV